MTIASSNGQIRWNPASSLNVQQAVARPEVVDYAVQEFQRQLQASLDGLDTKIARMRQRASQLQDEITNLAETAAQCRPTPALVQQIDLRQQELDGITSQLLNAEPESVSTEIARIRQFVTERLGNVQELLNMDVQKARVELAKHVTSITMVPESDGKKGHYRAEGDWNLVGGYGERGEKCVRMVAGEGFEPSTFGL